MQTSLRFKDVGIQDKYLQLLQKSIGQIQLQQQIGNRSVNVSLFRGAKNDPGNLVLQFQIVNNLGTRQFLSAGNFWDNFTQQRYQIHIGDVEIPFYIGFLLPNRQNPTSRGA